MIHRYWKQLHLNRRQPYRKSTAEMLSQNPDKTVYRAVYRAVNDYRTVLLAVFADVSQVEFLRHLEIQLHCAALPVPF
ncbi:hypothetical protein D3C76_1544930 [compost metagenome]